MEQTNSRLQSERCPPKMAKHCIISATLYAVMNETMEATKTEPMKMKEARRSTGYHFAHGSY